LKKDTNFDENLSWMNHTSERNESDENEGAELLEKTPVF
jgi:hypothetical protein